MRIRHPSVAKGTAIGVREAARKYGVGGIVISRWAAQDRGAILKKAAFQGDSVLIDEAWLQGRLKEYEPHRDNSARRRSLGRTLVETRAVGMPAGSGNGNGHGAGLPLASPQRGVLTRPSRGGTPLNRGGTPPGGGGAPVLNTREWVDLFYFEKARAKRGGIRKATKESYDYAFHMPKLRALDNGRRKVESFIESFPILPMQSPNPSPGEASQARSQIREWMHSLLNIKTGKELAPRSKQTILRRIATLYNWLDKEKGFHATVPNLEGLDLPTASKVELAFTQEDIRALLQEARTADEVTIVTVLAQVACREGELCSLDPDRPERKLPTNPPCACCGPNLRHGEGMLTRASAGGGWVHAFGKPTPANKTGKRILYLPEESYRLLAKHLQLYQRMSLKAEPLTEKHLRDWLRYRLKRIGIYQVGENTHGFRRAFEAEFERNGGRPMTMDILLGHAAKGMREGYFVLPNDEAMEQANRCAPRRFLQAELPGLQRAG